MIGFVFAIIATVIIRRSIMPTFLPEKDNIIIGHYHHVGVVRHNPMHHVDEWNDWGFGFELD